MKKAANKTRQCQMTRREFVSGAVAAAGVLTGAPALLRGRNLNDKLDIAFIACGGRALDNLKELTVAPGRAAAAFASSAHQARTSWGTLNHPFVRNRNVTTPLQRVQNGRAEGPAGESLLYNRRRRVFACTESAAV